MSFTVRDTGGTDWEPIPSGVYHAVSCGVVDLGTQFNEMYGNEQHQAWLSWELPEERLQIEIDGEMEDKPAKISRFYTVSLGTKAWLRQHLESWRGREFTQAELDGFDISKLLGANCLLNVIHKKNKKGETKAQISSIMPLSKNMQKRGIEGEKLYFSIEEHGLNIPESVPEGIKRIIMKSKECNETGQQNDEWREDNIPTDLQDSDLWGNNEISQEPPGGMLRQQGDEEIPF